MVQIAPQHVVDHEAVLGQRDRGLPQVAPGESAKGLVCDLDSSYVPGNHGAPGRPRPTLVVGFGRRCPAGPCEGSPRHGQLALARIEERHAEAAAQRRHRGLEDALNQGGCDVGVCGRAATLQGPEGSLGRVGVVGRDHGIPAYGKHVLVDRLNRLLVDSPHGCPIPLPGHGGCAFGFLTRCGLEPASGAHTECAGRYGAVQERSSVHGGVPLQMCSRGGYCVCSGRGRAAELGDAHGAQRNDHQDQEGPGDGAVTLGDESDDAESRQAGRHQQEADGDGGSRPRR